MVVSTKELFSSVLISCFFFSAYTLRTEGMLHRLSHSAIRSVETHNPDLFVDSLFKKYGNNGSLNLEQFINLLTTLEIGSNETKTRSETKPQKSDRDPTLTRVGDNKDEDNNEVVAGKCYSGQKLFDIFSLNSSGTDKGNFEKLCPAIVEQIDSKSCRDDEKVKSAAHGGKRSTKKEAWGYGFLSVTLISLSSILGAFVVPFMNHKVYSYILMFMVSLAVGVLCGSGLFHLVPHTFGFGLDGNYDYLWKCLTMAGGIYLFFVMEYLMKMYVRFKEMKHNPDSETHSHNHIGHSHGGESGSGHGHGNSKGKNGTLSMNNEKDSDNISNIAGVQLVMYKTEGDFHDTHGNSFCPSNELSEKPELKSFPCFEPSGSSGSSSNNSVEVILTKRGKKGNLAQVAPVAWMIVFGDALHNFIDGLAIGASFTSTVFEGVSTALAIFCEELPHELGDFAVLLNAGLTYKQAMAFNFFSACSCFAGLVVGLMLGYATSAVKWIYALAGGMFIYISLVDMMAEATEMSVKAGGKSIKRNLQTFALQNFGMVFGFTVMFILALYGSNLSV